LNILLLSFRPKWLRHIIDWYIDCIEQPIFLQKNCEECQTIFQYISKFYLNSINSTSSTNSTKEQIQIRDQIIPKRNESQMNDDTKLNNTRFWDNECVSDFLDHILPSNLLKLIISVLHALNHDDIAILLPALWKGILVSIGGKKKYCMGRCYDEFVSVIFLYCGEKLPQLMRDLILNDMYRYMIDDKRVLLSFLQYLSFSHFFHFSFIKTGLFLYIKSYNFSFLIIIIIIIIIIF